MITHHPWSNSHSLNPHITSLSHHITSLTMIQPSFTHSVTIIQPSHSLTYSSHTFTKSPWCSPYIASHSLTHQTIILSHHIAPVNHTAHSLTHLVNTSFMHSCPQNLQSSNWKNNHPLLASAHILPPVMLNFESKHSYWEEKLLHAHMVFKF